MGHFRISGLCARADVTGVSGNPCLISRVRRKTLGNARALLSPFRLGACYETGRLCVDQEVKEPSPRGMDSGLQRMLGLAKQRRLEPRNRPPDGTQMWECAMQSPSRKRRPESGPGNHSVAVVGPI